MTLADLHWRDRMANRQNPISRLAGVVAANLNPPLIHADWIAFQRYAARAWSKDREPTEEEWDRLIADFRALSREEIEAIRASMLARPGQPSRSFNSPGVGGVGGL